MGQWALEIDARSRAGQEPYDGFRAKYTAGGQGAGAKAHIAGIAGAKLIGGNRIDPRPTYSAETGDQRAQRQLKEDQDQLNEGLALQKKGYKTLENPNKKGESMIRGYRADRTVENYLAEKRAEIADDEAAFEIGNLLGQVYAGNVNSAEAHRWIFNLLCER